MLLLTLFAGFAWAEATPEEQAQLKPQTEPTQPAPEDAPAKVGYEKVENNVFPKTASYDGKWTVNGLSILDAQGKVALSWNGIGAVWRMYMTVSWSPDSQRVMLLDQFGRAQIFYAAELLNGAWTAVPDKDVNLTIIERRFYTEPKISLVDHVNLGEWVSMTAIQIQDHFLVTDIPLATAHWEDATAILQFTNGFFAGGELDWTAAFWSAHPTNILDIGGCFLIWYGFRMPFPERVQQEAMVACRRQCCLCHRLKHTKMQCHHIEPHADRGDDTFENCIPLCLECHGEVMAYNPSHPIGTKYTEVDLSVAGPALTSFSRALTASAAVALVGQPLYLPLFKYYL